MKTNMTRDVYTLRRNQDEKNYTLRTHMEMNRNPTYEHGMDPKKENRDTQKYVENHNQVYD
jgi:hypothetical protein